MRENQGAVGEHKYCHKSVSLFLLITMHYSQCLGLVSPNTSPQCDCQGTQLPRPVDHTSGRVRVVRCIVTLVLV